MDFNTNGNGHNGNGHSTATVIEPHEFGDKNLAERLNQKDTPLEETDPRMNVPLNFQAQPPQQVIDVSDNSDTVTPVQKISVAKYKGWIQSLGNLASMDKVEEQIQQFCWQNKRSSEPVREEFFEEIAETCRNKIREMMNCKNAFRQKSLKNDILNFIRKFIPDKEESRQLFTIYSAEIEKAEVFNLAELKRLAASQELKHLVRDYVPIGKCLLWAGAPKTGKTNLSNYLAICIAQGRPFLDRETVQGNVLVIQNEEHLADTTLKRFEAGIADLEISDPELYSDLIESKRLLIARGLDIALDKKEIVEIVKENNVSLVIVDSLGKSITKAGLTEYSPELNTVLYGMQEACFVNNFTTIILHHTTKGTVDKNNKAGKLEKVAGGNFITRAVDGVWLLEPKKGTTDINIEIIPRFAKESSVVVERIEEEARYWSYVVKEETSLSSDEVESICKILKVLFAQHDKWIEECSFLEEGEIPPPVYGHSLKEIIKLTGLQRDDVIKRLNHILDGLSYYIKNGARVYHIPEEGTFLEQFILAEREQEERTEALFARKKEELHKVELICNCKTKEEFKKLTDPWDGEEKKRIWNMLTERQREDVYLIIYPPKYSVGTAVKVKDSGKKCFVIECGYDKINKQHLYTIDLEEISGSRTYIEAELDETKE